MTLLTISDENDDMRMSYGMGFLGKGEYEMERKIRKKWKYFFFMHKNIYTFIFPSFPNNLTSKKQKLPIVIKRWCVFVQYTKIYKKSFVL